MAIVASMVSSEPGRARAAFRSPALALALAALFWSGNFVAGRALRGHVDPVTLNFLRWLIALALIAPFVWRSTAASLPVLRREWRLILALGATGIASFHTLVYLALQSTTATSALLMLSLAPIVTLLASAAVGMEHPTNRQIGGALISIVGAGVLITRGNLTGILSQGFNVGDLWMLLAVVIWAAYSLLLRRRPADLPSPVALAASIAAALAMMVPVLILGAADTSRGAGLLSRAAEHRLHCDLRLGDRLPVLDLWRIAARPHPSRPVRKFDADLRRGAGVQRAR